VEQRSSPDQHPAAALSGGPVPVYFLEDFFGSSTKRLPPGNAAEALNLGLPSLSAVRQCTTFGASYSIAKIIPRKRVLFNNRFLPVSQSRKVNR
jgi:hypothetical protein